MTIRTFPGQPPTGGTAQDLSMRDVSWIRAAAMRARWVLPGPVGELVSRELTAFVDFGYRFGRDEMIVRLAQDVLAMSVDTDQDLPALAAVPGR